MSSLPSYIDPEIWAAYCERRQATEKKNPFTPLAKKLLIKRMMKAHDEGWDVNEALETAAINGWLSIYPKKKRAGMSVEEIEARTRAEKAQFATKPPPEIQAQINSILGKR